MMTTSYQMPTFGAISNIFSTSTEDKDINVYESVTWYKPGRTYKNAYQITEVTPKGEKCSMLILEQKASGNQAEESFQVYLNGTIHAERFIRPAHKALMDFMYNQYIATNLPAEGETLDYQDTEMEDSIVPASNPFA
jgi:hypothetical protein